MTKTALALSFLAVVLPGFAQSTAQTSPCPAPAAAVVDVASVKPSDRPAGSSTMRGRADSLTAGGTAYRLIEYAYDLHDFQLTGGPGWLNSATWEIIAKVDQPPANYDSLPNDTRAALQRQRMQAVLAQRFALKCHFETSELPVYNLVLAKGGPRLTPTPADAAKKGSLGWTGRNNNVNVEANGIAIGVLIADLTNTLGRTVIDKTGLTGIYDFTLTFAYDDDTGSSPTASAPSGPTIFTALQEQLGLKLEPAKGPVRVLIIDSIDRPSEN